MALKPTKKELADLIALYGKKLLGIDQRIAVPEQMRLDTNFQKKLNRLQAKYPDYRFAFISPDFLSGLEERARKWIGTQLVTGRGKDF